ncbi:prepilin-type N-terminal cleavage/methylation domain-containing protein [uncultured Desulfosarcina sp.]|uniref:prepilin-type N-terminal cleavage/methylation domain-containing protein n=1 Tax=uncultured Desulfosarcina sp. TaxID=218289 RepID=UPI0029C6FC29|nr:prepilin-type N-terminal cleavage/methylation domain-containing protein [uncultured Desulfosarcina sp.]
MIKIPSTSMAYNDCRGFSLIEVMIAMAIFSIGLLAVAAMQTSAVRNNKTGNTYTQATTLARDQMELIKNGDISDSTDILNPGTFPTTTSDPNNPIDEDGQPGGIYTRSWTVGYYYFEDTNGDGDIDTDDTPSNFARKVTVTVTFPFVGRGTRQVSLTSVVTGDGL